MGTRIRIFLCVSVIALTAAGCADESSSTGGPDSSTDGTSGVNCEDDDPASLPGTFEATFTDGDSTYELEGGAAFAISSVQQQLEGSEPKFTIQTVSGNCAERSEVYIKLDQSALEENGVPAEQLYENGEFDGSMGINIITRLTEARVAFLGNATDGVSVTFDDVSENEVTGSFSLETTERETTVSGTFTAPRSDSLNTVF
jgi:hypothetical protein